MAFPSTLCVNGKLRAKAVTCPGVALATTLPPRLHGWPSCVLMPVPHVFVVMFQILAARGALALEDASGACGDCGPVDGPSGVDDGLHRFDDGCEPAFGGHDADVIEQVGPHASAHAVEQGAHGIGKIVPDRTFAPYTRLARDDREQARRIHLGPRRAPPTRSNVTICPPSRSRSSISKTRTPACKRIERHLGPARYRFASMTTEPVLSAFTLLQSHGSNPTPGKGGIWSFSASNNSRTGTPCR